MRSRGERGAATAELALGLPLLVAVTLALVWLLSVGVAQVRMVDAARETARAVARGESVGAAVDRGERVAPDGATLTAASTGDGVVVTASGSMSGPGGLLRFLPTVHLTAHAESALEPGTETGSGP